MASAPVGDDVRAVVCDDDVVTRSVITSLIEARGGQVIAEADRAYDAINIVERFVPNLAVIDLALGGGAGIEVVRYVRDHHVPCQVVVFTLNSGPAIVLEAPALRVIEKPHFDALARALDAAIIELSSASADGERRRDARPLPPAAMRASNGLDDAMEFYRSLAAAEPGDVLIGIPTGGSADSDALIESVRSVIRSQDRMTMRQQVVIVLLVAATADGAASALGRLAALHPTVAGAAKVIMLTPALDPANALDELCAP